MPDPSREERHLRIAQVKQDWAQRLLANPNVVAVGIGPKIVAGEATGEPAIRVFVRRKLPADQVPPDELIPAEIDGVTTDVALGGDPIRVAAPVDALGAVGVLDARANPVKHAHAKTSPDDDTHRPLTGGRQIAPVDSNGYVGTMGCLLWDPANHDVGYALTNMHVVQPPDVPTVTRNVSKIGQPSGDDSSSRCCNDVIGVWAGGGTSDDRDEALVKLSPGQKWQAKIEDIGLVAGAHPLTPAEVTAVKYKVAKRGRTTKLTGGTVAALQATTGVADNLIIVDPNPNPGGAAGDTVFFDIEGDSGSALVNDANQVVGLVYARNDVGQGFAYEIGHVLGRLRTTDSLTVEVASSTNENEVHVVPGATSVPLPPEMAERIAADPEEERVFLGENGRAPLARPWFADLPPAVPTVQQALADLRASDAGRLLLDLWQLHREEVLRLLDTNRRVTIAWHRGGGAALMQLVLRLPAHPDRPLPDTLYGEPLMVLVDRLHATLGSYASQGLRVDLARARELLPDLGGRTYPEIVQALAGREPAPREREPVLRG
jgi:hypothetical protein